VKKKKRHDTPREHDREGVATDETANTDSKQLENAPSNVHDPSLEEKKGRDNFQAEAQAPNEDTTAENSASEKKVRKRKREKGGGDGQAPDADSKKDKKRKDKEKKERGEEGMKEKEKRKKKKDQDAVS
jgi:hypothetical protein